MTARPLGLFDQEIRQRKLQALGDPLVAAEHHRALGHVPRDAADDAHGGPGSAQGRPPPHDAVRMFKVLVQRELYARSDEQVEYPTADRLSFQRFLGIDLAQEAPDYTAIWRFRERLGAARMKALFEELGAYIDLAGFEARKSPMLDASLVQKPKTRKPAEPKDGEPELTRQQAAHRDGEANWTQKYDRSWFGYKNHINADVMHGFIRDYAVTPAATHDSQALPELLDITQRGQPLYAELGEDPRAGRTRIRAPRPVPQGPAAALHGLGARRGGDRADQLRAQPAAAGDDGAAAAAGARARADEVSAQGTCAWSRAIRGSGRSGRQQQRHSPRCAVSRNRSGGMRQVQNRFFKLLTTRTYGVSGSGDLQVWLTHEWMLLCSRFTLARCGFRFRPLSRSRR